MFERETHGDVLLVRLAHGKASAFDLELTEGLAALAAETERGDAKSLVITGTGRIFSAGVDLKRLVAGGEDYAARFYPALVESFVALFRITKPVVIAVNGHAIAGGCILTAVGDVRIMARGAGRIGVPELHVGLPFPPGVLEIMRATAAPHHLGEILLAGATWEPEEGLQRGLLDEVVDPERLMERALEVATTLAALPADAFALAKRQLRGPALEAVDRAERNGGAAAAAAWRSEESRARVAAWVERSIGRGRG